jgi:predicted ribosome quality control (RQC) complex YloA/Tae2 family protein
MENIEKLKREESYDVTIEHRGYNEKTGHMVLANVTLLENGGKEIELANKKVKEAMKVTKKRASILAIDQDFSVAVDKALEKAAGLLGL